jgi:hypothetical protein
MGRGGLSPPPFAFFAIFAVQLPPLEMKSSGASGISGKEKGKDQLSES